MLFNHSTKAPKYVTIFTEKITSKSFLRLHTQIILWFISIVPTYVIRFRNHSIGAILFIQYLLTFKSISCSTKVWNVFKISYWLVHNMLVIFLRTKYEYFETRNYVLYIVVEPYRQSVPQVSVAQLY